jgi:polyisoprenoid-binding protein YceI
MTTETDFNSEVVAGTWTIDPSHSEVGFTVRHLMSKVRGQFTKFEGSLTTGTSVESARATATIDLTSIDTRDEQRDGHLRSSDFFDVEQHGQMSFTTTTFDGTTATGDLTIKGVTHPVELDVEFLGAGQDPWGNARLGFEANGTISRKKWGVDFNIPLDGGKVLIGDNVSIHLAVEAVLDKPAEA